MNEMHSTIDRLEARIDRQAARIDALYALLEARGILARAADAGSGDAFFDDPREIADTPLVRETRSRRSKRPPTRLRVGNATGV